MCDHILIISRGRLVASDTPENLETRFSGDGDNRAVCEGRKGSRDGRARQTGLRVGILRRSEKDGEIDLIVTAKDGGDIREELFTAFSDAKLPILNMSLSKASLEEIFLEFTQEDLAPKKRGKEAGHGRNLRA